MRVVYDDFPKLERAVVKNSAAAVERSAKRVADNARKRTPPRVDSGRMMEGWRVEDGPTPAEKYVTNTQPYHVFQELGTATIAPHPMLIPASAEDRPRMVDELARVFELHHGPG